jgi:hypothetical protein
MAAWLFVLPLLVLAMIVTTMNNATTSCPFPNASTKKEPKARRDNAPNLTLREI